MDKKEQDARDEVQKATEYFGKNPRQAQGTLLAAAQGNLQTVLADQALGKAKRAIRLSTIAIAASIVVPFVIFFLGQSTVKKHHSYRSCSRKETYAWQM